MAKAATVTKLRRVTKKDPDPNPLFTKWLQEWKEAAVVSNSKLQHVYGRALKSLKKYPLVLKTGKEAKILEYFGDKLCNMLDKKLEEHRRENPDWCPASDSVPMVLDLTDNDDDSQASVSQDDASGATTSSGGGQVPVGKAKRKKAGDAGPTAKKRGPRRYIPLPRSGAHAILMILGQRRLQLKATWAGASSHDWMSKSDLIVAAQPLCDASFTQPLPDTHYTAWSCMATLIKKGLVTKQGCPARFSLTDEGEELACRLIAPGTPPGSAAVLSASQALNGEGMFTSSLSDEEVSNGFPVVTLPPPPPLDSLRIVLLVDSSETTAISQERFLRELRALDIPHEVRRLNVGDFAWVCRSEGGVHGRREWVVGPLVERKRTDDLAKSIMDGRFHEQKVRLVASGIKPLVYLIEETGGKSTSCISDAAMEQGILNTQVSDGFLIKWTRDPRDTACFLGITTCHLQTKKASAASSAEFLEGKPTWEDFNAGGVKSRGLQVREMLALNLLQVKGLSLDKVMPLVEKYPTPIRLFEAFERAASDPRGKTAFLKDCGITGKALHEKLLALYGSALPLQ